jgi:hypothetical protein
MHTPRDLYRIKIAGHWDLVDLYEFPHVYSQVYSVLYVLENRLIDSKEERKRRLFSAYPWKGGYSTVNWFNGLYYTLPPEHRPRVISMHYASPGWIDLGVYVGAAVAIRQMLIAFSTAGRHINETYNEIQHGIHERKLNATKLKMEELKLESEQMRFVTKACEDMAKLLGFRHLNQIHSLTGNPLITLKMVLSMYRRVRTLAEFEADGKTRILEKPQQD